MSQPTKRIGSDFLKRILSLRVRSGFNGVIFLRDLLRQNADKANLGASVYITNAEEVYDVVPGDSYIQSTEDCTVNLGKTQDGQTLTIKCTGSSSSITLEPQGSTLFDGKSASGSIEGVHGYVLRYVEPDDNWVIISTQ